MRNPFDGLDQSTVNEARASFNHKCLVAAGIEFDVAWGGLNPYGIEGGLVYGVHRKTASGRRTAFFLLSEAESVYIATE